MTKLLRSNFARMFKSYSFIIGIILMIGFNLFVSYENYDSMQLHPEFYSIETMEEATGEVMDEGEYAEYIKMINSHESLMFNSGLFALLIIPVIISLFIGTDFSDGTIRNKLMVGHRRINVYLANLITLIAGSLILYLVGVLTSYLFGLIFFKYAVLSAWTICKALLTSMLVIIAAASIFTFLSMLFTHLKAGCVVVSIVAAWVMFVGAMIVQAELSQVAVYDEFTYADINTREYYEFPCDINDVTDEMLEEMNLERSDLDDLMWMGSDNPYYPQGIKLALCKFVDTATPGAHLYYVSEWEFDRNKTAVVWSAVWIAVTTAAGLAIFRKRNLK